MTSSEPETASPPVKEIKSDKDGSILSKRKIDETNESNKKINLGFSPIGVNDASNSPDDERKRVLGDENGDQEDDGQEGDVDSDDDGDDFDEEDDLDDDDDDGDGDDEDEYVNGGSEVVDRKGKGIMKDDKGKGKLIEESEDSSSDYAASLSDDDDSDLSDDPLAEVDLDNILPTRTRRHTFQPGVNISKARVNKEDQDDDDASDRKL